MSGNTTVPVRYHTQSNHDFHMSKWGYCVYCVNGCRILEEKKMGDSDL